MCSNYSKLSPVRCPGNQTLHFGKFAISRMRLNNKVPLAPHPFLPEATSGRNCMYILKASEASCLGGRLLASDCMASITSSRDSPNLL